MELELASMIRTLKVTFYAVITILAKRGKSVVYVTLLSATMCFLLVSIVDISGGFRHSWPSAPESWNSILCSKTLGVAADHDGNGRVMSEEKMLRDVVEVDVAEGSIFFLETSCSKDLTPRQACAVESAARADPKINVYVLMTSPVVCVSRNGNTSYARLLSLSYPNVRIHRLHLGTYSRGTPLEAWFSNDSLAASGWIVHHASDALRFLTLWKYGGTYLDLDMILMKSLAGMRNFAGVETDHDVASSVINLEGPGGAGHALADDFLRDFVFEFRGDKWSHNGPGTITRVLGRVCKGSEGKWSGCPHGFKVYPKSAFDPIHWSEWRTYFNESMSTHAKVAMDNSFAAHIWNKLSSGAQVRVGSRQPYGLLASMYCPVAYRSCGKTF